MQIDVDQRRGRILHRRAALIEIARRQDAIEQGLRHRLTRAAMAGIFFQDLRHFEPVFVKLRRQLDEIARYRGAGQQRIGHVGQETVERVAKFVKQRARIVEAQ